MKQIYIKLKNNIEENKYQLNKKIEKITNKQVEIIKDILLHPKLTIEIKEELNIIITDYINNNYFNDLLFMKTENNNYLTENINKLLLQSKEILNNYKEHSCMYIIQINFYKYIRITLIKQLNILNKLYKNNYKYIKKIIIYKNNNNAMTLFKNNRTNENRQYNKSLW